MLNNSNNLKINTLLVQSGQEFDPVTRAIVPPVFLTSTYVQESPGISKYEYGRTDNPNFRNLEKALTSIEKNAIDAVVFSSGTGAINAIVNLLAKGEVILCDSNVYSGTRRIFVECFEKFGIKTIFSDASNLEEFRKNLSPEIKLIWIETPTNPLLKVNDINEIAQSIKGRDILFVVDSTFATPLNQSPLFLGANLVLYSTTKYIAGHSDVIGGAVTSNSQELINRLRWNRNALGLNPSPFDCWLIQRGLKTLEVRITRQQQNALKLAQWLEKQDFVERVIYPGLDSYPQANIVKKQMKGYSGMISVIFNLKTERIKMLIMNLKIWKVAESLGSVESLIDYPWCMTQSKLSKQEKEDSKISEKLVRFSVGIEDVTDLINDIELAIRNVQ